MTILSEEAERDSMKRVYFNQPISSEFFETFCGDFIGEGIGRCVFQHAGDPSCVIKIEWVSRSFQNPLEWDLWTQHSRAKTSVVKWLAPCIRISGSGGVLIQKKVARLPEGFKLPKFVPSVLCNDMKFDNWGLYKGRLVCHDYGRHEAVRLASLCNKGNMEKAAWLDCVVNGKVHYHYGGPQ